MRGTGTLVRLGISVQAALSVLLAGAVAIGLTWLSERPGVRVRYDLTATGENTFNEVTRRKIGALPDDLTLEVDAFFVAYPQPMTGIGKELHSRFFRFLLLAKESRRDIVELTRHELGGPIEGRLEAEARMRELGFRNPTEAMNTVVLSYGGRRAIINLLGDVAEVDIGGPQGNVPPRIVSYRGEEAFVRGLLKVTSLGEPRTLFSWGHGERDLYSEGDQQLSRLRQALLDDGFRVGRWDSDEVGAVPLDCDVLAIIGPQQPLSEMEKEWIREFLDRGGRLIGCPGLMEREGDGGLPDLLAEYGVLRQAGIVCRPYVGPNGSLMQGRPECMDLSVRSQHMAIHPITDPLRRGDRRVRLFSARPLVRGVAREGGLLLELLQSDALTWADLPGPEGAGDAVLAEGQEVMGPFPLAMISHFPLAQAAPAPIDGVTARKDARVLAFGTPVVFGDIFFDTNRDLALNAFNWAADREFRVSISTRDPERRLLPLGEGDEVLWVRRVAVFGLPLLCLLLGLLRWMMRRAI